MKPATVRQLESPQADDSAIFRTAAPLQREPRPLDYALYLIGIPAVLGLVFSLVGTRLTYGMPYPDALVYMLLHMFTAWWSVNLGAAITKYSFRSWQPPTLAVCLIGLLIALIPAAFLFQKLGDYYATLYPVFATNRADNVIPAWDFAYLMHFLRYSLPVLPTFLAGVYGYRYATGVDWFGYPQDRTTELSDNNQSVDEPAISSANVGLIEGSKLPADSTILAIKAEQHYIQIWSDQGTDLVRYRFSDIPSILANCNGAQVHRSWWVNLDSVQTCNRNGRKMELVISDELTVPVSLSYKNAVLQHLE